MLSVSRASPQRRFRPAPIGVHGREAGAGVKDRNAARRVALMPAPASRHNTGRKGRKPGRIIAPLALTDEPDALFTLFR